MLSAEIAFDLSVKANLENLEEIRSYIDRAGKQLGVRESVLADLCLVVDEAVTNIVIHGYGEQVGDVDVHMETIGNNVSIRIRDHARTFDVSQVEAPHLNTALKDRPFGGMGIFLIRKMTDKAEFLSLPGGGNEIRLLKKNAT